MANGESMNAILETKDGRRTTIAGASDMVVKQVYRTIKAGGDAAVRIDESTPFSEDQLAEWREQKRREDQAEGLQFF